MPIVLVLLQAAGLILLVWRNARVRNPAWPLLASSLFALHFLLEFLIPQIVSIMRGYLLLGSEPLRIWETEAAVRSGQLASASALAAVMLGWFLVQPPSFVGEGDEEVAGQDLKMVWLLLCFAIGGVAALILTMRGYDSARSELVKSAEGKILYAATFMLSAAASVATLLALVRRNWLLLSVVALTLFAFLLPLGGRQRILFPIVVGLASYYFYARRRFPLGVILVWLAVGAVLFAAIDPLVVLLRGGGEDTAMRLFTRSINPATAFTARTFDGFHNLAVIVHLDAIPKSLSYLFGGSGEIFMGTYFPRAVEAGVGYPTTFFGDLWIIGGAEALLVGSMALGMILGCFDRLVPFVRRDLRLVIIWCTAMPWLTFVGGAFFDQGLKVVSMILAAAATAIVTTRPRVGIQGVASTGTASRAP